ncbi:acetyltransferase [Ectothiorhodospiraceae bacterium 2226]|nr:acetyltransferase [Ectothiorhodospiraceae bacterium 2226]
MQWPAAEVRLRPATAADAPRLRKWDREPHVRAATGGEDWAWEVELAHPPAGIERFIAELAGRPIGFLEITDPARDATRYWGALPAGVRALDIWIGEPTALGRGFGTQMMRLALARCFADPAVTAVLVDPLVGNQRAHRFYVRLGFRFAARRRMGGDDCFIFRLERQDWAQSSAAAPE